MNEWLHTAARLVQGREEPPTETDLRRAVSTAYYALFHDLAELCADQVAGHSADRRTRPDWRRVYRSLDHGRIESVMNELDPERKAKAKRGVASLIDWQIEIFAETLERLKALRHAADYDPAPMNLSPLEVQALIDDAAAAMMFLNLAPEQAQRQLAFACIVGRRKS